MTLIATLLLGAGAGQAAEAGAESEAVTAPAVRLPCDTEVHRQFDFWLGDWLVFDASTNELVAFDRVEKQQRGCVIVQSMTWLTDQFRRPGLNFRLSGTSTSIPRGERWLMLWVDVHGGSVLVEGGLQKDGSMALTTMSPRKDQQGNDLYTRGVWVPRADGSVRNIGYMSRDGKTNWKPYFEYVYRPNR